MSNRPLLPSTLHYTTTFETSARYKFLDEEKTTPELVVSGDDLDVLIEQWVDTTKNLILATGPVSVIRIEEDHGFVIYRTVALVYAPAIRREMVTYGQETDALASVSTKTEPRNTSSDGETENVGNTTVASENVGSRTGRGNPLRLPEVFE